MARTPALVLILRHAEEGPVPDYRPDLGPCLLWTGGLDRDGYGRFRSRQGERRAHRASYEEQVGPIPEGLDLDHLCRVRNSLRVSHLEPTTPTENNQRSPALQARYAAARAVDRCPGGHPYDTENTRWSNGKRQCRACDTKQGRLDRVARNRSKT